MSQQSHVYKYFNVSVFCFGSNIIVIDFITKKSNNFQVMNELLAMGPPVYFVLSTSLNTSQISNQNLLCGGQLCQDDSIVTQLYLASKKSES